LNHPFRTLFNSLKFKRCSDFRVSLLSWHFFCGYRNGLPEKNLKPGDSGLSGAEISKEDGFAMRKAIVMDTKDNVATLLTDVGEGDVIQDIPGKAGGVQIQQKIPFGHKIAIRKIGRGEAVVKYGEVIGKASEEIIEGQHVHVHNVESVRGRG
jgi:altronate dehydratase small subunit